MNRAQVSAATTGMRRLAVLLLTASAFAGCGDASEKAETVVVPPPPPVNTQDSAKVTRAAKADESVLRYEMLRLDGTREDLAKYKGKVVLVVNTATECGFTPQLEGLQALYESRRGDGFVLLGFPSNDFAGQEPRSDEEIAEFCEANYGVTFPMFGKTIVVGADATPLFKHLGAPDWNFNKYLLDRRGRLEQRWGSTTTPDSPELVDRIDALLQS